jgi:hypothetical protein
VKEGSTTQLIDSLLEGGEDETNNLFGVLGFIKHMDDATQLEAVISYTSRRLAVLQAGRKNLGSLVPAFLALSTANGKGQVVRCT